MRCCSAALHSPLGVLPLESPIRVPETQLPWNKWQRRQSQERDGEFPNAEQGIVCLQDQLHRNNCMLSNLRRGLISWHAGCIDTGVNQTNIMNDQFESNYALLVRSEEKGRGVLEILVYAIFFLSVVSSIWQFAQTPLRIPAAGVETHVAHHTTTITPFVRS